MSLGLHESRIRRRRQRRWAVIRTLLLVGLFVGSCWIFYEAGRQLARAEVDALRQQLEEVRAQVTDLQIEAARLENEVAAARRSENDWQARYERDVPRGELAQLLELARDKLTDGVPGERLAFVLDAVKRERDCEEQPETRRFLVRTPIYRGGNDSAAFAEGTITVSATGLSATDGAGNPEAWFDPAEPVRIVATQIGGESSEFEGELPLHFSIVRGDTEFLFTARPGDRGFLNVTQERCAFP